MYYSTALNVSTKDLHHLTQPYLQFELKLSTVACFLARDGDLTTQLQGHGAVQDA